MGRLWFGKKNDENQEMAKRFWFGKRNDESEDMEKKRFLFGKREDEPEVPDVTGEENKGENVTPEEMKELEELVGEAIVSDAVQEAVQEAVEDYVEEEAMTDDVE